MDKGSNPKICAVCGSDQSELVGGTALQQATAKYESLRPLCVDCFVDGQLAGLGSLFFSFSF
jgi:hypothetical protein